MEITVTEMNESDEITIRTRFSNYCFRLTDPVLCRGLLRGGILGSEQCEAIFAGAIKPASLKLVVTQLEQGSQAIFLVSRQGVDRLTTSIIREIELTPIDV